MKFDIDQSVLFELLNAVDDSKIQNSKTQGILNELFAAVMGPKYSLRIHPCWDPVDPNLDECSSSAMRLHAISCIRLCFPRLSLKDAMTHFVEETIIAADLTEVDVFDMRRIINNISCRSIDASKQRDFVNMFCFQPA